MRNGMSNQNRTELDLARAVRDGLRVPLPPREDLGLALTFLVLLVGLYAILLVGEAPLPVKTGELAPYDFRARAGFVASDGARFAEGALIQKKGAEVGRMHIKYLEQEREAFRHTVEGKRLRFQRVIGLAVVLLVLTGAAGFYISRYRADLMRSRLQRISFTLVTLGLVGLTRLFVALGVPPYLVPMPMVVMVLCLVYDQRFGFEMATLYGLLVAIAQGGTDTRFAVLMLGAMTAALLTGNVRTRGSLIKAGLVVGCEQWAAALGLGLLTAEGRIELPLSFWESPLLADSLWALCNGVMCGFLVNGLLPAIERLFGVTTDIRLLEWSDPNQPLLQRLLLDAPGTYHHSMVVGSLAADAAEACGANPLLARVSAYFHDIGKLKKPEYFAENLPSGQRNPHEDLSPMMSRLVITAHPRDGAEMARMHGLPKEVRNIILQSHGSTVTKYFWDRAKGQLPEDDLDESSFRYRLPKPQSKEAACVMLADAVESAARSLGSPSPSRISAIVEDIIWDRLHDHQLDESGLTVTDLNRIERTLVRGLNAAFHNRIRYPGQEADDQGPDAPGRNQQQAG